MAIRNKPRIIIWIVSDDGYYVRNAINILESQHNGVEILGVTAIENLDTEGLQFIPLNEISMNGGGL